MNKAILNTELPQYAERLRELGYEIIPSFEIPCQMPYERRHADLQCLIMHGTAFVLSCCTALIKALSVDAAVVPCGKSFGGSYPDNVCLSAVPLGDRLLCRVPSLDENVRDYCEKHDIALLNVRQGYARCACAVVSDDAVITADRGIFHALQENGIKTLPIGKGSVLLEGADYGFPGGATGYDKARKTLYFCGNIRHHPDGERIARFCADQGTRIECLGDGPLVDIGGIVFC